MNTEHLLKDKEAFDALCWLIGISKAGTQAANVLKFLRKQNDELVEINKTMLNIIHQDKGEHLEEHGWKESARLAILAWQDFRMVIDQLNFEVESRTKERDTAEEAISTINEILMNRKIDLADKNQSITNIIAKFYE